MDSSALSLIALFMVCIKRTDTTAVKVHIEYLDDVFTPRTQCIIREAVELISRLLTLRDDPRSIKFHVPRERRACASLFYDGPNAGKCGQLSQGYTGAEWCGAAKIPAAHLKGLQVFGYKDTEPLPESLQEGYGFTDGTNFVLYLTARESQLCTSSLAHSRVCRRDEAMVGGMASGRPVAGVVNACWKEGEKGETEDILIRRVIFHELMHLMVMNYRSMREFVECEGRRRSRMCWKVQEAVKVVNDKVVVWSRHFRKAIRQQVCEDVGHCQFYSDSCGCSHEGCCVLQDGIAVENVTRSVDLHGGVVLAKSRTGVHWPPELFANSTSVMVPRYMESGCIILDPLTLALLKTSGWYLVNCSALPCINCFLISNPYVCSLTCSVLEKNNSSTNEDIAHPDGEVMNTKETLSITNVKVSHDSKLFSASEDESGDETLHSTGRFDTHTQVAVQTKGHNDSEVSPDLKSDASLCFPSCVLMIIIQIFVFFV